MPRSLQTRAHNLPTHDIGSAGSGRIPHAEDRCTNEQRIGSESRDDKVARSEAKITSARTRYAQGVATHGPGINLSQ